MHDTLAPENFQRILVVDDDPEILQLVSDKLDFVGYEVFTAGTGEEALELIERQGLPHLAVVDINMPGMDGFEFCRTVHSFCDMPVILLTAVDEEETIIRGIQYCAEDYVIKPFSPRELVARIQRVLRRMGDFSYTLEAKTQIDDRLTIDFTNQQVMINGEVVALTPTETKLLHILVRNTGHTVTNGFLLRRLWPDEEVFEDTLRVHVARLRKKIETNPAKSQYIFTQRGTGYRFEK